jgi:hypothetical protein
MSARSTRSTAACLLLVIAAVLWLGAAEGEFAWFAFQTIPAVLALLFVALRRAMGVYGAPPVFLFWLVMLVLLGIWLFVGSARHVWWEFVLTAVAVAAGACGIVVSFRAARGGNVWRRCLALGAFTAFQIGACCLSAPYFGGSSSA